MVTIADIADKLGISKGTVSKALSDAPDISETLRKTILETAVEMGYTKLRRKRNVSKKVCVLIYNMEYTSPGHFGYDIIMGFRQMAEPAGLTVDVIPITKSLQKTTPYDVFMLENDYIGSLVMGISLSEPWIADFKTSRTPAVLFDNYVMGNPSVASVAVDNDEGMELAVNHLKSLGHKKIGYLSGALGSHVFLVRHRAFFAALKANGLPADPQLSGSSYYISECIQKHLPRLLERGVTAIICSHDQLANAAMVQCQELGKKIPEDLSIIGFDDLPMSPYTAPPLNHDPPGPPSAGKVRILRAGQPAKRRSDRHDPAASAVDFEKLLRGREIRQAVRRPHAFHLFLLFIGAAGCYNSRPHREPLPPGAVNCNSRIVWGIISNLSVPFSLLLCYNPIFDS